MLLTTEVEIKITKKNIDWFLNKGYQVNRKEKVLVQTQDLQPNSTTPIQYKCDICKKNIKEITYRDYFRHQFDYDCCEECQRKLYFKKNESLRFEDVKHYVEIESNSGCKLLSTEYNRNSDLLHFQCKCGNDFWAQYFNFTHGNKRQCNECGLKNKSGENCYKWKGGRPDLNHQLRETKEYKEWRKSVVKRDNYTCQCCGSKKLLRAHHIKNFMEFEDLRFNIENGITLCSHCHDVEFKGSFHYIYGVTNNNEDQLNNYIKDYQNGTFDFIKKGLNWNTFVGKFDLNDLTIKSMNGNVIDLCNYFKHHDNKKINIEIMKI
jgi:hypothetical protein